jgi:4-amino-4-deoxy-L-arabinose transferase-like glycosyltransferase
MKKATVTVLVLVCLFSFLIIRGPNKIEQILILFLVLVLAALVLKNENKGEEK